MGLTSKELLMALEIFGIIFWLFLFVVNTLFIFNGNMPVFSALGSILSIVNLVMCWRSLQKRIKS